MFKHKGPLLKYWRSMGSAEEECQGNTSLLQSTKQINAVFNRQYSHSQHTEKHNLINTSLIASLAPEAIAAPELLSYTSCKKIPFVTPKHKPCVCHLLSWVNTSLITCSKLKKNPPDSSPYAVTQEGNNPFQIS